MNIPLHIGVTGLLRKSCWLQLLCFSVRVGLPFGRFQAINARGVLGYRRTFRRVGKCQY